MKHNPDVRSCLVEDLVMVLNLEKVFVQFPPKVQVPDESFK